MENTKKQNNDNDNSLNNNNALMAFALLTSNITNQSTPFRENTKNNVTLSGILNQIDGLHNNHGMILIMTTNYPEKLDKALIRDGRVDERIFFDYCDHEQIYMIFKNFYNENSISLKKIKEVIDFNKRKISPSNVENSMRRYYNDPLKALNDIINFEDNKTLVKFEI